jgi:hypothetical protein
MSRGKLKAFEKVVDVVAAFSEYTWQLSLPNRFK